MLLCHKGLTQWGRGGLGAFCSWGQRAYFLNSQGAPSIVPLPGPNIFEIWDLQGPKTAQKQPKLAQISQNGGLKVLVVPNGWNSVERSWNGLWEVQAKVFEPIWRSGTPPISAQGCPKTAQIGPDWPKWRFEGSGGPKRLEQCGTKLERALGGPGQGF